MCAFYAPMCLGGKTQTSRAAAAAEIIHAGSTSFSKAPGAWTRPSRKTTPSPLELRHTCVRDVRTRRATSCSNT